MQENQENPEKIENTNETSSEVSKKKASRAPLIFSLFGFIISILLILAIIWIYYQLQQTQENAFSQTKQLEKSLTQTQEDFAQQLRITRLTENKFAQIIRKLASENQTSSLEEIEFIVRSAAYHLALEGDINVTIKLLEIAEQKMADLNNPKFLSIQQTLSNKIAILKSLPKIDVNDLFVRINTISEQMTQLPIIPSQAPLSKNQPETVAKESLPWWRRIWFGISQSFHNMLIIRRHQLPVEPLISPDQKDFLVQNIQVQLSLAQWALLHHQPLIYQQSLQKAMHWIQHYFVQNASATQNILKMLTELQNINIKPPTIDFSDVLTAIQNAKKEKPTAQPSVITPSQGPVSS